MIDIERKKQQAINEFYETHCEAPHEMDLLFGFDSGYNLGLDERNQLAAQVERLREALIQAVQHWEYDGVSPEHGSAFAECNARIDETPAQSLWHTQASAIEDFCDIFVGLNGGKPSLVIDKARRIWQDITTNKSGGADAKANT